MEIYLIRHTKVAVSTDICYGQSDVALAESFQEEAEMIQQKLPNTKNLICYTSPLTRCNLLAEKIPSREVKLEQRLMELNFGDWELKTWESIGKQAFDAWHSDFVNNKVPNGESYLELYERSSLFWKEIISKNESVILITHGGVIRALLAHVLGLPLENSFRLKIDFCRISKVIHKFNQPTIEYISL